MVFTQDNRNPLVFDKVHASLFTFAPLCIKGWTAKLHPASHPAATFQFDVFVSAGGGRFVPDGETNAGVLRSLLIAEKEAAAAAAAILQGPDVDTKRR